MPQATITPQENSMDRPSPRFHSIVAHARGVIGEISAADIPDFGTEIICSCGGGSRSALAAATFRSTAAIFQFRLNHYS